MKAVIVSPYFSTLGGGERYALTFAQALLGKGWQVDLTAPGSIIDEAKKRFSLPLDGAGLINFQPFVSGSIISRWQLHRQYDLIFWFFDGAIPLMMSKHNLLHFQVPFTKSYEKPILGWLKKRLISLTVCNSIFTQKIIKKVFGVNSVVWYPPIDIGSFTTKKKERIILSVGRFEESMTEKRQDILIDCFKEINDNGLKGWSLIFAGGVYPGRRSYLDKLIEQSKGYPIEFEVNVSFLKLVDLYSRSAIFWHAAGYGYDELSDPEKMEHFGMTTVEAMASGCVPVVIGKGGQKEIIEDSKNGFLCNGKEEMIHWTNKLIADTKLITEMSAQAVLRAGVFSTNNFRKQVYNYLDTIK